MPPVDRIALAVQSGSLPVPAAGIVLVLHAAPSPFLDLVPARRLRCVQSFRPLHDALRDAGHAVAARAEGPAAMAVVNLTRSRAETLGNIAQGLDLLAPGGTLVVAGAKNDGVDSLARQVARAVPLDGAFVKAHGRVFWLTRPAALPEAAAGWARESAPARNAEGFLTAPGMFSPDHADPGSRRLAAATEGHLAGRVADLGAGWGWLAQAALAGSPAITELDLYEAEALALDAARANVPDPRARFHWADATRLGLDAPRYDAVIANPPFHQTRTPEPDLGAAFIAAAARILKPSGQLHLVANRQLPYEAVLAGAFRDWEKLGEDGVYKLLRAERPRRGDIGGPMPDPTPELPPLARLRVNLRMVAALQATITYHEAARGIGLTPPHVIHSLTTLLEALMAEDAARGHPFIAAMVVSRARDGLPAPGFFEAAARLGRYRGDPWSAEAMAWHAAELALAHAFHAAP